MAKCKTWYSLPSYNQEVTTNISEYVGAWRAVAAPIETHLGLKMSGFDPGFMFTKDNPQGTSSVTVSIPLWFALDLSRTLTQLSKADEISN